MITFECMKKAKDELPEIIETITIDIIMGKRTVERSAIVFVKNKHGYTLARYCRSQDGECWTDGPSTHPFSKEDEWYPIDSTPVFSLGVSFHEEEFMDSLYEYRNHQKD